MMGERAVRQEALFYGFNLDEHVPRDHLLRSIDRFVELSDLRRQLAPYYSATGRPLIDPELTIRMLLIGYCCGIRSERRLCDTAERFGLWPERLVADTGYGSAAMLAWLVHEQGIEPHVTVFDKSTRKDGTFSRSDFTYDHKRGLDVCPTTRCIAKHRAKLRASSTRRAGPMRAASCSRCTRPSKRPTSRVSPPGRWTSWCGPWGWTASSPSQVSRLCGEIDERVQAFLTRPIEGDWPYVWLDATYVKARRDGHIVSVAVIIAVGANTDGRRAVLGMTIGNSEAEPFWTEFLRSLARRGLRGVRRMHVDPVKLARSHRVAQALQRRVKSRSGWSLASGGVEPAQGARKPRPGTAARSAPPRTRLAPSARDVCCAGP